MKKLNICTLVIGLCISTLANSKMSLQMCTSIASEMSKSFPQRINRDTTLTGAVCQKGESRPVLMYHMVVDGLKVDFPANYFESMRATQLNGWCSNAKMRKTFTEVDITYSYYDRVGIFVGELNHRVEECSMSR